VQGSLTSLTRGAGDGEDCQHAVANEFQDLASEGMNRPCDTFEPGIKGGDHRRGLRCLGKRSKITQISTEERRTDGLSGTATQRTGLHPGGAAPAEIGLEQR
jgi:hypothetical protein